MRTSSFRVIAIATFTAVGLFAAAQSPAPNALTASYSLTQTGFGSADRVTNPGAIYVIRTDGLLARAIADHVTPTNTFKDGKLIPPSKGFLGAFGTAGDTKQVEPGSRFYLHAVEMKDGAAVFTLLSLDKVTVVSQNGSTSTRLRMYLKFPVSLETSAAQLHALTDPVFSPEGTAAPTQTVTIGESSDDVIKALGAPQQEIDLVAKRILVYKQLKITLIDGKVTDAS